MRLTVTPDLKGGVAGGSSSKLYLLDLSGGRRRLGGSALAQCYSQIGDVPSDLDDAPLLRRATPAHFLNWSCEPSLVDEITRPLKTKWR